MEYRGARPACVRDWLGKYVKWEDLVILVQAVLLSGTIRDFRLLCLCLADEQWSQWKPAGRRLSEGSCIGKSRSADTSERCLSMSSSQFRETPILRTQSPGLHTFTNLRIPKTPV